MVPGHLNDIKFTALRARAEPYLGQCAEFCGTSHANMRFRVYVHTPADFAVWVKNAQANAGSPASALEKQGQEIFMRSACIGCHTVQGSASAGKVGPDLTHVGARTTIGAGMMENTPENLERWIANSADAKPGSKMPAMLKSAGGALGADEIKAIAAYLSGLK
jgi:cytochrome c oxidase subunit 2